MGYNGSIVPISPAERGQALQESNAALATSQQDSPRLRRSLTLTASQASSPVRPGLLHPRGSITEGQPLEREGFFRLRASSDFQRPMKLALKYTPPPLDWHRSAPLQQITSQLPSLAEG